MDIPRRENRQHSDKLTAELLFFCLWLTRCGEVELGDFKWHSGERSSASYRRYAEELAACGAIPRLKLRDNGRRFISAPPVEEFVPTVRFDLADDHLRRLARLVCMAASVLAPDGELSAFDNAIEDYGIMICTTPTTTRRMRGWTPARSGVISRRCGRCCCAGKTTTPGVCSVTRT